MRIKKLARQGAASVAMKSAFTTIVVSLIGMGAGAAIAQDAAQPARPPQAGPQGAPADKFVGRPAHPPQEGGAYGVISSVSTTGFVITQAIGRAVPVTVAPDTAYRLGKARASKSALKVGDRVRVLGLVDTGTPANRTLTIRAAHVVLQPVDGAGSETSLTVAKAVLAVLTPVENAERAQGGQGVHEGGAPGAGGGQAPLDFARKGLPVPPRHIGNINPNWGDATDPSTTIAGGAEADKAIEVAMAAPYSGGGMVDRVVKEADGTYLVHNLGIWPHHIFVSSDYQLIGADNTN